MGRSPESQEEWPLGAGWGQGQPPTRISRAGFSAAAQPRAQGGESHGHAVTQISSPRSMLSSPEKCGQADHPSGPAVATPTPARAHLAEGSPWEDRGLPVTPDTAKMTEESRRK